MSSIACPFMMSVHYLEPSDLSSDSEALYITNTAKKEASTRGSQHLSDAFNIAQAASRRSWSIASVDCSEDEYGFFGGLHNRFRRGPRWPPSPRSSQGTLLRTRWSMGPSPGWPGSKSPCPPGPTIPAAEGSSRPQPNLAASRSSLIPGGPFKLFHIGMIGMTAQYNHPTKVGKGRRSNMFRKVMSFKYRKVDRLCA